MNWEFEHSLHSRQSDTSSLSNLTSSANTRERFEDKKKIELNPELLKAWPKS